MNKGSVDSIETFGLVDGPGIRTVVFLNGCNLRCKYCHNPEMWNIRDKNYTPEEIVKRILKNKPYFQNNGGATFSGGEPLLQYDFLLETCKLLKQENIHITIDTAGIGNGDYQELFKYIDTVLLDIKHITKEGYENITQRNLINKWKEFVKELNKTNIDVWIRQVIVPGINDNKEYMDDLIVLLKEKIKNVKRIDFLPFHRLGREKYLKLNINYPYEDKNDMDKEKCNELYKYFIEKYNK